MEGYQVIQLIIAFVAGINLPVIFVVIRRLGQIRDHLAAQNGRIGRLEEWKIAEEKRTDELKGAVETINERCMRALRQYLHKEE